MPEQVNLSPIEAHECAISKVFSDSYAFEIPPYQRPYAWETEQARDLLNDISNAMDNTEVSGGIYFIGSIVLIKSPNKPLATVIDGQQRLTTLTILLSVLRDMTVDDERRIERRAYIFQKSDPDRGTNAKYRLLLREKDRGFFLKWIQNSGATDQLPDPKFLQGSEQRIAENAQYIRQTMVALSEDRRNKLFAFIIQQCFLVVVAVPSGQTARRIFTVLNARGLDLAPTDILKADLLDRAGDQDAALAVRWEVVEDELGRDSFVELFTHIRMIYEREKPRIALEEGFQVHVTPFKASADEFISNILEPISDAYIMLKDSQVIQEQFGEKAAKAVRSLHRIDNKDWMPPALLRLWIRKPDDSSSVADFLIRLERLAYYLFVTRADVNERISRFNGVMFEFQPLPNTVTTLSQGLVLSPEEQGRFLSALSGPLYSLTRVCKPVLQRLDESLAAGGATYDTLVSIEHVLPQTVEKGSEWEKLFPDEPKRKEWTHRIGNLVLLTHRINSSASNWDFMKKKEKYFQSKNGAVTFALTYRVLQTDKWTLATLENNQKELIEKLQDVWQLSSQIAPASPGSSS
jgi:hypothetical protein